MIIKKAGTNAETLANALTSLEGKFGGAAAAQVNTFSGAWAQLSNTFGDLLEQVGNVVVESPALVKVFKVISGRILTAITSFQKFNAVVRK